VAFGGGVVVARHVVALGLGGGFGRELLAIERAHVVEVYLLGSVELLAGIIG